MGRGHPRHVAAPNSDLARLLRLFPSTVEVPPLRLHLEDLDQLVTFFLGRLSQGGRVTCSPAAMRLFMRSSWPGNVSQLHRLLSHVVQHRRSGVILPADLPPEAQTVSRRLLSPLESMERDAIVKSLARSARQQGQGRAFARHVPGHDLPQGPRVRDRALIGSYFRTGRPNGSSGPPVVTDDRFR